MKGILHLSIYRCAIIAQRVISVKIDFHVENSENIMLPNALDSIETTTLNIANIFPRHGLFDSIFLFLFFIY